MKELNLKIKDKIWHPEYGWCSIEDVKPQTKHNEEFGIIGNEKYYSVSTGVLPHMVKVSMGGYTIHTDYNRGYDYKSPNKSWFKKEKNLRNIK